MRPAIAILASGGLDSSVLIAESCRTHRAVHPLYIRCGLAWEAIEQDFLGHFLETLSAPALQPLRILDVPVGDVYGKHWSITQQGVPGAESADEAVYLPGRNLFLITKAAVWCVLHGVSTLALAPLDSNPFADSQPAFQDSLAALIRTAMGGALEIVRPYQPLTKAEVVRRGAGLALEWTMSCIRPVGGRHCGRCNKCAERQRAFEAAGVADGTAYSTAKV